MNMVLEKNTYLLFESESVLVMVLVTVKNMSRSEFEFESGNSMVSDLDSNRYSPLL